MKKQDRREFLKMLAAGAAGVVASGAVQQLKHAVPVAEAQHISPRNMSVYPPDVPGDLVNPPNETGIGNKCNTDLALSQCPAEIQVAVRDGCNDPNLKKVCQSDQQKKDGYPPGCATDIQLSVCTSEKQKFVRDNGCDSPEMTASCKNPQQQSGYTRCDNDLQIVKCESDNQKAVKKGSCNTQITASYCEKPNQKEAIINCDTDLLVSRCPNSIQKQRLDKN